MISMGTQHLNNHCKERIVSCAGVPGEAVTLPPKISNADETRPPRFDEGKVRPLCIGSLVQLKGFLRRAVEELVPFTLDLWIVKVLRFEAVCSLPAVGE